MPRAEDSQDAAIGWVLRLREPGLAPWEEFTAWLEADPLHASAYDIAAMADQDAAATLHAAPRRAATLRTAGLPGPAPQRSGLRRHLGRAAAAAALVAAVGGSHLVFKQAPTIVASAAGERRSVTLADGSRIELNGDTRLAFDAARPRAVRLESGEALFSVQHDAARPFAVTVGDATLRDVGTIFNVVRTAGRTEVAVAEGGVSFERGSAKLLVAAGGRLVDGARLESGRIDPASVGGWRRGRLVYRDATVAQIAADLTRNIGEPVAAAPTVAGAPFTGVIVVDPDRHRLFVRLSGVLGISAAHSARGWQLGPRAAD